MTVTRPLRIAQVVPYVSVDAAFGGPVAVSASQSRALAARGHRVLLLAGGDGRARLHLGAARVRLLRAVRGRLPLPAVVAPGLIPALLQARGRADVIHLHVGRDLTALVASVLLRRFRGVLVLQLHGMVMPDARLRARLVDLLVMRPLLRRAGSVLALTDAEEAGLREVSRAPVAIRRVRNGVEVHEDATALRPARTEVLFLARLHPRKNAPVFVEAAARLLGDGLDVDFIVAGPDEGDLATVVAGIAASAHADRIRVIGAVPPQETTARLARSALFVLPSTGEVFPMSVLEALAVATPVVLTADCGLAEELGALGAAMIVPPTVDGVVGGVRAALASEATRAALGRRGHEVARELFSADAVAAALVEIYRESAR